MPTAAEVKHLRERSGAGWIACRDALVAAELWKRTHSSKFFESVEDIALELLRVNRAACAFNAT